MRRVRAVVLACDGLYQRALTRRLAELVDLCGIVRYSPTNANGSVLARLRRHSPLALVRHLAARVSMLRAEAQARPTVRRLFFAESGPPHIPPHIPLLQVADINTGAAVEFVKEAGPDLVCVNGTNLLRGEMLALADRIPLGVVNLHTGLSPYARGGNCNLFVLLEGRPELVGVTVHHIDAGVDSGDIILSARPPLALTDNYESIEAKVFHLGIELLAVAIRQLSEGRAARVRQWEEGRLYLRRTGYVYSPTHRATVNRLIRNGLIRDYLRERAARDAGVRVVGAVS